MNILPGLVTNTIVLFLLTLCIACADVTVVSTQKKGDKVIIKIQDNGPGIPEEHQKKIFEPFFTTKGAGSGTGLGLSLSYDIVTKVHKGSIDVDSTVNEGTTFTIELPIE